MNDCIFCKIAKGEAPCKKVYEDNDTIAFLDVNPANPGHILVVPKKHVQGIVDVDENTFTKLMTVVKKMSMLVNDKLKPDGINILRIGELVNHLHIHVLPRYKNDHIAITLPRYQISDTDMEGILKKLKESPTHGEEFDFRF